MGNWSYYPTYKGYKNLIFIYISGRCPSCSSPWPFFFGGGLGEKGTSSLSSNAWFFSSSFMESSHSTERVRKQLSSAADMLVTLGCWRGIPGWDSWWMLRRLGGGWHPGLVFDSMELYFCWVFFWVRILVDRLKSEKKIVSFSCNKKDEKKRS